MCDDEQAQVPEGSEFQTEGACSNDETVGGKGCVDLGNQHQMIA